MTKKRLLPILALLTSQLLAVSAFAVEPIKVLLVTRGVSLNNITLTLARANNLLGNSGLGSHDFISAAFLPSGVAQTFPTNCSQTNAQLLLACVVLEQSGNRDQNAADIVLVEVGGSLNQCGSTLPGTTTRPSIGQGNRDFAYAVVKKDCVDAVTNGQLPTPHEFGHILSLEHLNEPIQSLPIPINHPKIAESPDQITIMGNPGLPPLFNGDCSFLNCTWHQFYSEDGKNFPNGAPAGDKTKANAKKVVQTYSWNVVANYRPLQQTPAPPICFTPIFETCTPAGRPQWRISWSAPAGASVVEWLLQLDDGANGSFVEGWRGLLEDIICTGDSADRLTYRTAYITPTGASDFCPIISVYKNCPNPPEGGGPWD